MGIKSIWDKNKAEILALLMFKMPSFVYGVRQFKDIPIFCFHSARYPDFERQLSFIKQSGFRTLDGDELLECLKDKDYKNNGKDIVLTFDDGLASVWVIAFPLLKRYNLKIISFILPGLIENSTEKSKQLDDCTNFQEILELSGCDHSDRPLCNWAEIQEMHESGLVDFQSHGMLHRLVSTTSKIVDYIHPDFDISNYGYTHVPEYQVEEGYSRKPVLGHPVYSHSPLLKETNRYEDSKKVRDACAKFVELNGGRLFFGSPDWREKLSAQVDSCFNESVEREKFTELDDDIVYELVESKRIIEEKLNKRVKHFCFPWFAASRISVEQAYKAGYETVHLGATAGFKANGEHLRVNMITRVQEEYFLALPGYKSLPSVIRFKMTRKASW